MARTPAVTGRASLIRSIWLDWERCAFGRDNSDPERSGYHRQRGDCSGCNAWIYRSLRWLHCGSGQIFAASIAHMLTAFPQYSAHDGYVGKCWKMLVTTRFRSALNQRAWKGLSYTLNYTYSKNLGDDNTFRTGFDIRPRPHRTVSGTSRAVETGDIRRWRSRRTSQPMASTNCRLAGVALATITSSSADLRVVGSLEHLLPMALAYLWQLPMRVATRPATGPVHAGW